MQFLEKLKDYKKITDFPFKNNWYELTIKRLIRYASDNGFDAVAVPKGSVAAKRYGQNIGKLKVLKFKKIIFHHQVSGQKLNMKVILKMNMLLDILMKMVRILWKKYFLIII